MRTIAILALFIPIFTAARGADPEPGRLSGRWTEAKAAIRRALEAGLEDAWSWNHLAILELAAGGADRYRAAGRRLLDLWGSAPDAHPEWRRAVLSAFAFGEAEKGDFERAPRVRLASLPPLSAGSLP